MIAWVVNLTASSWRSRLLVSAVVADQPKLILSQVREPGRQPPDRADAFTIDMAAAIIAGMIHTGEYTIPRIKSELIAAGIPIRKKW